MQVVYINVYFLKHCYINVRVPYVYDIHSMVHKKIENERMLVASDSNK